MMYEFQTSITYEGEDRNVSVRYEYDDGVFIERVIDIETGEEIDPDYDQVVVAALEVHKNKMSCKT